MKLMPRAIAAMILIAFRLTLKIGRSQRVGASPRRFVPNIRPPSLTCALLPARVAY
jgi:hypothetical protein